MNYFDKYGVENSNLKEILSKLENIFNTPFTVGGGWGQVLYRPPIDYCQSLVLAQNNYQDSDGEQLYDQDYPKYKYIFEVNDVDIEVSNKLERQLTKDGFMSLLNKEKI